MNSLLKKEKCNQTICHSDTGNRLRFVLKLVGPEKNRQVHPRRNAFQH